MDQDFLVDRDSLLHALELMENNHHQAACELLPLALPESGLGARSTLDLLAPIVLGGAARLGGASAVAHMDPPTPWITWATALWNASLNQNLLHPTTAPVAREIEQRVVQWLTGFFGMTGGHMTPGSTLANLTAIWAARECAGITEVIASEHSHLSIAKAAHILGLSFRTIPTDGSGALVADRVTGDLSRSVLVLTAGTTSIGTIDPMTLVGRAGWTHVDAAWGGPLRLTRHSSRLSGIEGADSVSVSAHKLLFQPKESAVVLFRNATAAHSSISFGGAYLAVPNVGVLGSHGAVGVPLLATFLAWGRSGIAARIERCIDMTERIADFVRNDSRLILFTAPQTGIVVWRPKRVDTFDLVIVHRIWA
jgi:L-2,4-diaminobutyrate decarboxylase